MLKYLLLAGALYLGYKVITDTQSAADQRAYLAQRYPELVAILPRMTDAEVGDLYLFLTKYNSLSSIPATADGNALRDRLVAIGAKYNIFS